jgi:hypothetical protein
METTLPPLSRVMHCGSAASKKNVVRAVPSRAADHRRPCSCASSSCDVPRGTS